MSDLLARLLDHSGLCWACRQLRPCAVYDEMMSKWIGERGKSEMPKFKKKPDTRVFEVEQFFRSDLSLVNSTTGVCQCEDGDTRGHVHTIHKGQVVDLEDGDWVMPEPDGEHYYPIKPDIFERTYEPV